MVMSLHFLAFPYLMVHFNLCSFNAIIYKSLDENILDQIVWQWFHQLFDTYISGWLDGERIGVCSHLLVVAGEHRGL
jgi:hypothetical protein